VRAANVPSGEDPALGWRELVDQPVQVREVPGDLVTLLSESNVGGLAALVQRCLEGARERCPLRTKMIRSGR
jgi:hypothetical protein